MKSPALGRRAEAGFGLGDHFDDIRFIVFLPPHRWSTTKRPTHVLSGICDEAAAPRNIVIACILVCPYYPVLAAPMTRRKLCLTRVLKQVPLLSQTSHGVEPVVRASFSSNGCGKTRFTETLALVRNA